MNLDKGVQLLYSGGSWTTYDSCTVSYRNRMWSKIRQVPLRTLSYCHPSLACIRNRVLPQEGESRPVLSPTQRSLSRQIMKAWLSWSEVIASSQNSRMLEQLILYGKKKHNDSWVNLKGGGQLTTKTGDGVQMCGMVPGLGSVSGCPRPTP